MEQVGLFMQITRGKQGKFTVSPSLLTLKLITWSNLKPDFILTPKVFTISAPRNFHCRAVQLNIVTLTVNTELMTYFFHNPLV